MVINNGLTVQFGSGTTSTSTDLPITYTSNYIITVGHKYYNNYIFQVVPSSLSQFSHIGGPSVIVGYFWLTIGY